ncbi:MAG: hypothetical protein HY727_08045 [Candidatus Rokubacteria bacterium]|nr:hypothetical protein [Candidatus Rokubacteria bacterium]
MNLGYSFLWRPPTGYASVDLARVLIVLVPIGLGVATILATTNAPRTNVLEAGRFVVRDSNGHVRCELGGEGGVPFLALYNDKGQLGVSLGILSEGWVGFELNGDDDRSKIVLAISPYLPPHLTVYDKDGNLIARVPPSTTG